jgi:O-antigen ligase/capsular polysaccharide biosynthesis protein
MLQSSEPIPQAEDGVVESAWRLMLRPELAVLAAGVAAADLSFRQRDLDSAGLDPQSLVKLLIWLAPLAFLAQFPTMVLSTVKRGPIAFLVAYFVIGTVLFPFSDTPLLSIGTGVTFLSMMAGTSWAVYLHGWRRVMLVVTATYLAISVGHALFELLIPAVSRDFANAGDSFIPGLRRIQGVNNSPTVISVSAGAMVVTGLATLDQRIGSRRIGLGAVASGGVLLLWSQSRISILAVAVIMVIAASRRRPALASIGVVGVVAAVLIITPIGLLDYVTENFSRQGENPDVVDDLTSGRSEIWPIVIDLANESPVIGRGLGAARFSLSEATEDELGTVIPSAHNFALQTYFTLGVVGSLLMIGAHVSYAIAAARRPDFWRDAVVLFVIVQGLADTVIGESNPRAITFVWLAALAVGASELRDLDLARRGVQPPPRANWSGLGDAPRSVLRSAHAHRLLVGSLAALVVFGWGVNAYLIRTPIWESSAEISVRRSDAVRAIDPNAQYWTDLRRDNANEVELAYSSEVASVATARLGYDASVDASAEIGEQVIVVRARSGDRNDSVEIARTFAEVFVEVRTEALGSEYDRAVAAVAGRIAAVNSEIQTLGVNATVQQRSALEDTRAEFLRERDNLETVAELERRHPAEITVRPTAADSPVSPSLPLDAILAVLGGLVVGVTVATAFDRVGTRLRSAAAVERAAKGCRVTELARVSRDGSATDLGTNDSGHSLAQLLHGTVPEGGLVLVVGVGDHVAAFDAAERLAGGLAGVGRRALVVDADLAPGAEPVVRGFGESDGGRGLAEIVAGEHSLDEVAEGGIGPLVRRLGRGRVSAESAVMFDVRSAGLDRLRSNGASEPETLVVVVPFHGQPRLPLVAQADAVITVVPVDGPVGVSRVQLRAALEAVQVSGGSDVEVVAVAD